MRAIEILRKKNETTLRYLLPGGELLERTWGANWRYDEQGRPVDAKGKPAGAPGAGAHHVTPHDLAMCLEQFGEEIGQRFDAWIRSHDLEPGEHRAPPAATVPAASAPAEPRPATGRGSDYTVLPLPAWIAARMGIDPAAGAPPAAKGKA